MHEYFMLPPTQVHGKARYLSNMHLSVMNSILCAFITSQDDVILTQNAEHLVDTRKELVIC